MSETWHLAQCNVARTLWARDDARMADFFAQVPAINALADTSPGFVWRWDGLPDDPALLVNISVWESIEPLKAFAYQSAHVGVFRDRARWFQKPNQAPQVLWWVPAGHRPDLAEALARLEQLRAIGPTPAAFTFTQPHPIPNEAC